MTEPVKIGSVIRISADLLDDYAPMRGLYAAALDNMFNPPDTTSEGWKAHRSAIEAARIAANEAITATHSAELARREGVLRSLLELHAPHCDDYGDACCEGCKGDSEYGQPAWPCDTYALIADAA